MKPRWRLKAGKKNSWQLQEVAGDDMGDKKVLS
jgi:hypothetical protein